MKIKGGDFEDLKSNLHHIINVICAYCIWFIVIHKFLDLNFSIDRFRKQKIMKKTSL